jgi:hypothetical protein
MSDEGKKETRGYLVQVYIPSGISLVGASVILKSKLVYFFYYKGTISHKVNFPKIAVCQACQDSNIQSF